MIIKKLQLKHFRNYNEVSLEFNNKVNVFTGNNAQGKTNIIEGIYALAITKSHRTHVDSNMIQKDYSYSKIKGLIKKDNEENDSELDILINSKGKKASINNNSAKKVSDYISYFNVIIFHPDDLELVKGSPSERRRFLNVEIGQLDNKYLFALNNYNSILKNRNEYLKNITIDNYDKSYLEILTNQLVDNAAKVYMFREQFINDINESLKYVCNQIKEIDYIKLKYETSIPIGDLDEIKKSLLDKYNANLKRDICMMQTIIGPHRDDFIFLANDKNVREYGSQGQQRMAVLCLKLAEIEFFKEKKGEYPVLLLDDAFSELDNTKKKNILKYLNKRMQIMITTTDINDIDKDILKNASTFLVSKATVTKNERDDRGELI